jgi:glycosyltransferase involved in cell wall biosynthesis
MPGYGRFGGVQAHRRLTTRRRLFEVVDLVTTPSEWLAEAFRAAGARQVVVIENYLADEHAGTTAASRQGTVVGWIAALEHQRDLGLLPVRATLGRLLEAVPDLHVWTIGIALGLQSARYRHIHHVEFSSLVREASAFDIGIAPLAADLPINLARSNVKLKEYAAAGVPWLASPIGPYANMGAEHGGRLVQDELWHEELERLILDIRLRRKLAKRARRWGRTQTIAHHVQRWERELLTALERVRGD